MNKKNIFVLVLIFFSLVIVSGLLRQNKKVDGDNNKDIDAENILVEEKQSFVLPGFPEDFTLFGLEKVDSMKYFVNDDESSKYLFGGAVNYYNVVYKTSLSRTEVFSKYRNQLSSLNDEESTDSKLMGTYADYSVSVSQYEEDSSNVYVQLALPLESFEKTNKYFAAYPNIVEIAETWTEKESSYGLLNQKGGEVEYWQYFVVDNDELLSDIYQDYKKNYQEMNNFTQDDENQKLTWNDKEYFVTLTFSNEQGRIFLMIRKPM